MCIRDRGGDMVNGGADSHIAANKGAIGIGAKLYRMGVTGPRVIVPAVYSTSPFSEDKEAVQQQQPIFSTSKKVAGIDFQSYGMHGSDEAWLSQTTHTAAPQIIVACAIGIEQEDIDTFVERLEKLYPAPKASSTATA
eukprot:TRINITY_DN23382_c0_g1_i3.p1 TRINITY_DN23382_c0_g1~~TRINITY_DN23382_c0_g1_i3.p1  ORF type:complete len:138 (+),score=32.35 TRINITY_DN23382_c0_g1_i3:134-547(+)